MRYVPSILSALILAGCANYNNAFNSGPTFAAPSGPTPQEQFKEALSSCPLQLRPIKEIAEQMPLCEQEGVNAEDNIAATKCVAAKLRQIEPLIFKEYPALSKIEAIAIKVPTTVSASDTTYQQALVQLDKSYAAFAQSITDKNPHQLTKCRNQAVLTYLAPSSASPAAYYEFTASNEEIALKQQNGKLSAAEASIEQDKALAVLKGKLEQANAQRQQAAMIQAQVDAANAQAQAADMQARAARAMAIQNAFKAFQPAPAPAIQAPAFRMTNCHAFGNNLNCTSF